MLTVFPSPLLRAFDGRPGRALVQGQSGPWSLLNANYGTDAHFALYWRPGASGLPRHKKAALRAYDDAPEGMPVLTGLAFDVDLPGHAAWASLSREEAQTFLDSVQAHMAQDPDLFAGAGTYATAHGLRVLVTLPKPCPASHADSLLAQALDRATGLPGLDTACRDWTRLFRVPYATRDGQPQDHQHVTPTALPSAPCKWWPVTLVQGACPLSGPVMDSEAPLQPAKAKAPTKTDMKGLPEPWLTILVNGYPLETTPGQRHAAIVEAACALGKLAQAKSEGKISPHQVFWPMAASVQALGDPHRFWAEAWKVACWVTSYALAQEEAQAQADRDRVLEKAGLLDRLATKLDTDLATASKCLVIHAGGVYWVLDQDSLEYTGPYRRETLVTGLRDYLPEFCKPTDSPIQVLANIGTSAQALRYHYGGTSYYDCREEVLWACMAKVPNPAPVYHADVAGYLDLWGPETTAWLAAVRRIDRPCAALYADMAPGCGKSLLATLVAQVAGGVYVPFEVLSGSFNEALRNSWFVWGDEAVDFSQGKSPATTLRLAIGNSTRAINVKYQDASDLQGYLRVLLTANNEAMLRFHGTLNEDDIAALQQRVIYVRPDRETQDKMRAYLKKLRADYATAKGFAADHPHAPNYLDDVWKGQGTFLEHLSWLEQNHVFKAGDRFLVTGKVSSWSEALRTRHGVQGALVEVLAKAALLPQGRPAVALGDGNVYVNLPALTDVWGALTTEEQPTTARLAEALRALSNGLKVRLDVPSSTLGRVNYWQVDAKVLEDAAVDMGVSNADTIVAEALKTSLKE